MKRITALLLALLLALTLFGCKKAPDVEEAPEAPLSETQKNLVLPYDGTASLNPFLTENRHNRELSSLLYEPLFRVDETFSPVPVLATGIEMDGVRVTVPIRQGVVFSDGDTLTARDVAYSFSSAKESAYYAARLSGFFSCTVENETVIFTLFAPNVDCANCLDFPIVKLGTAGNEAPVGCGRYVLRFEDGAPALAVNESAPRAKDVALPPVALKDVHTSESVPNLVQLGDIVFLSCDPALEPAGKISAREVRRPMSNLVFFGFNASSGVLADPLLRAALSAALDRTALTDGAYGPDAAAAMTPFPSDWAKLPDAATDEADPAQLLLQAGYAAAAPGETLQDADGEPLTLKLLVNEESEQRTALAKSAASAWRSLGVKVEVEALSYETYLSRLEEGSFSAYVGEVKLSGDLDLSVFFADDGSARYGLTALTTVRGAYADYRSGAIDLSTFLKVFREDPPFVPVCYRNMTFYYTRALTTDGGGTVSDPFSTIESWTLS